MPSIGTTTPALRRQPSAGGGVVNNCSRLLSGGDLQAITTNNACMSAAGSLSSGWLANSGTLQARDGTLSLAGMAAPGWRAQRQRPCREGH